jgi:hypothetical protein
MSHDPYLIALRQALAHAPPKARETLQSLIYSHTAQTAPQAGRSD